MIRRLLTSILLVAGLSLVLAPGAFAETEAELLKRLESLKAETRRAGEAFDKAHWALDETEVRISRTDKKIAATTKQLKIARRRLNSHANSMYRREGLDIVGFLVGASDFEDLVSRMDYLSRIGESDARVVTRVEVLTKRLRAQRRELNVQRKAEAEEANKFRKRYDKLNGQLKYREREFKELKAKLDAVRSGGSAPSGVSALPGPNGMVFPVVGSYYYADTWGASRSGGRRRHQGTDIMAPRGTPIVAILSGTVRSKTNGLGGKTIWLTADNGWEFYYAHLDTWVVKSGRVKAGQVIATNGSTGNASGGAPHLHLQIHPGGGGPVNPYPYLRAME